MLAKDFGVREFRSPATSEFVRAVENAVLRLKKNYPDVSLVYLEKYEKNTLPEMENLMKRYDDILVPNEYEVKHRSGKASMIGKLGWLAEHSDFVFVHSSDVSKLTKEMMKRAGDRYLFDLCNPPLSWKGFVAEKYAKEHGALTSA